jgi:hypothetical protein
MSEVLTKLVVDCSTGIETIIPLTAEEIAQREVEHTAQETARAEQETARAALAALKASAKAKLVAGTPLTDAEAATIVL